MQVRRYNIKNSHLKKIIKYIWVMESRSEIDVSNILIPANSMDLILNFSDKIRYILNERIESITEKFRNCIIAKSVKMVLLEQIKKWEL